jgi:CheY-like chemotaxis protein
MIKHYYCKTVLLIDDNDIDNALNEKLIRASNFAEHVIIRQTAKDALLFLKNDAISHQIPDIIILDITMPMGNGFEFLEAYEKLPDAILNQSKIVMLTSSLDERDHKRANENKLVKIVLNKPLSFETLEELKNRL